MPILTIMRHAKAVPGRLSEPDHTRRLAARGAQQCQQIAERMNEANLAFDRVLVSRAQRTCETLGQLLCHWTLQVREIAFHDDLYEAPLAQILDVLSQHHAGAERLLLIGHNPGMSDLCNAVTEQVRIDSFPTASVAQIELSSWADLPHGQGRLQFFWQPK